MGDGGLAVHVLGDAGGSTQNSYVEETEILAFRLFLERRWREVDSNHRSPPRLSSIRAVRAEIIGRSTDVFRRDREFDVSALQGRLSTSSQSQCSTDPGLIAGTWHRPLFLTRDRWFESGSLQRRGFCELPCSRQRMTHRTWRICFSAKAISLRHGFFTVSAGAPSNRRTR